MNQIFGGIGRFVVRFRFLVVLFWIVLAVLSSKALPSMSSEVNNNNANFLSASAPSSKASTLAQPVVGGTTNDSQIFIVASRRSARLTNQDQASITREIEAATQVNKVISVRQVGTSSDGQASQILVEAHVTQMDDATQKTIVDDLAATFAQARAPAGLQFHLAGEIASSVANAAGSNKTGGTVQIFSLLFILILLLFIFRSLLAPILTLVPPVFALIISMRFIGGLGAHGIKISEITTLLLIILLLGAGTDYGLFLVFRVREEIRRGLEPRDAVAHALVRVGESITASAGTVIVALLTLLLATFGVYSDLAVPLAVGVGVMLLAGLTLLPALLAIFGRAVFWPSKVVSGTDKQGWWDTIAVTLVRRPARTLGIGVLIFVALASFAVSYHAGGFGGSTTAPAGSSAASGDAIVAAHFPHSSSNPANLVFRYRQPIWDDATPVTKAQASLEASGQLRQVSGPLTANGTSLSPVLYSTLHTELGNPALLPATQAAASTVPATQYDAYRASAQFVSKNGQTIQFEAAFAAGSQESTAALHAVPAVRHAVADAARVSGAIDSGVAGQAAGLSDVSAAANHSLFVVFPIAILAIGILLGLVLRSLIAPLYLIVSVALSYLSALGVSTLLFIDIGGEGGLTFVLPFLMFIFLLALGEDYNILVMTRIREEAQQLPLREAVARAVGKTGPTVTSAGVVLAGTFGVLAVSGGGGQITDIGAGLAIGILMDTFLVRTLLVPATVVLLGRWNWWPSRMSRMETASAANTGSTKEKTTPDVGTGMLAK
jgi:RND superfamily putative drug exporter